MKELSFEKMEEIQGGGLRAREFICNMTAGGIGTIWGSWAGGIALAVGASTAGAGFLAVSITLVASSAISSVIC
jgi:hypothetical protein